MFTYFLLILFVPSFTYSFCIVVIIKISNNVCSNKVNSFFLLNILPEVAV